MSRIDEIKERLELRSGTHWEMKSDIKYLLSKLEIAEKALALSLQYTHNENAYSAITEALQQLRS